MTASVSCFVRDYIWNNLESFFSVFHQSNQQKLYGVYLELMCYLFVHSVNHKLIVK